MRDLNYDLKQLCQRNRDGSFATQADREHILDLIADQLHEMGFRHMNAHSLKPKHVEKQTATSAILQAAGVKASASVEKMTGRA
jgi:hypothetical protein